MFSLSGAPTSHRADTATKSNAAAFSGFCFALGHDILPIPTMAPADFLLIDIGNSTTKLRLARARGLSGATRRVPTADLDPILLIRTLGRARYRRIVLCSVVPAAAEIVAATLAEPMVRVSARLEHGVDLSLYPQARTLGADRLANLAAAIALHAPAPLIAVDFGTAATFNVVDARGRFLGGAIAPGLGMLSAALHERTAQLPAIRPAEPRTAIGRSTRTAMLAGAVHGYRGLVSGILAGIQRELGPAKVVATGGGSRFLAAGLPEIDVVDPDLTLHGLRLIGVRHYRKALERR